MRNWQSLFPQELNLSELSQEACCTFGQFYDVFTRDVSGLQGEKICNQFLHHLLFYGLLCLEERSFPALNKCWDELNPVFGGKTYDNQWLFYSWLFCDFPLEAKYKETVLDSFVEFLLSRNAVVGNTRSHLQVFHWVMKSSRLGVYQVEASNSQTIQFYEVFTNKLVTAASVSRYEPGEIFLARIINYLGHTCQVHKPQLLPHQDKGVLVECISEKQSAIAHTGKPSHDYEQFMKLAGPYWMSHTHPNQDTIKFSPVHYRCYYD